jgi:hypothetical protein
LIDERGHQRGGEGADILTAKALALSALLVAVATAGTERQLDADSSWHPRHEGYPLTSSLAGDRPRCVGAVGNRVEGLPEWMSPGGP